MVARVDMEALRREYARRVSCPALRGDLISRRQAISTAGMAAAGLMATGLLLPPARALALARRGLRVVRVGKAAVFLLDGHEVWRLDPALFAGAPVVGLLPAAGGHEATGAELRGARYPGTSLALRFRATVLPGKAGYRLRLQFIRCGAHRVSWNTSVPFLDWLGGHTEAATGISARQAQAFWGAAPVPGLTTRVVGADQQILFDPSLALTGIGACEVSGLPSGPLIASRVAVAPLQPGDASVVRAPAAARSLLTLERGDHPWPATLYHAHRDGWALRAVGQNVFDAVRLEANDGGYALTFEPAARPDGELRFYPSLKLGGLALVRPLLVVARDGGSEEWGLVSAFAERAGSISRGTYSVELGTEESTEPLQLGASSARTHTLTCAPALRTLVAPMPDAITAPIDYRGSGVHLAFDLGLEPAAGGATPLDVQSPGGKTPPTVEGSSPATGTLSTITGNLEVPSSHVGAELLRADDLLLLRLGWINFTLTIPLSPNSSAFLQRSSGDAAYLVVYFPPQYMAEYVQQPNTGMPTAAALAGWSRLVFEVPAGVSTIPYALSSLLDWSQLTLSVAPTATLVLGPQGCAQPVLPAPEGAATDIADGAVRQDFVRSLLHTFGLTGAWRSSFPARLPANVRGTGGGAGQPTPVVKPRIDCNVPITIPAIQPPASNETALEVPYRLYLSPNEQARWAHAIEPATHAGVTELWHTRLGVPGTGTLANPTVDEVTATTRTMRAIWSPDWDSSGNKYKSYKPPFDMSLTANDRWQLVSLMGTRAGGSGDTVPLAVNQLMLSSLGAWLNVRGSWSVTAAVYKRLPPLSLKLWRHIATMGRDQYVVTVHEGYLLPFGHKADLITVTERVFVGQQQYVGNGISEGVDSASAVLQQTTRLMLREPLVTYGAGDPSGGRLMPFKSVRVKTVATPILDSPPHALANQNELAFYPYVGGQWFPFHLEAQDWTGRLAEWKQALVFVDRSVAFIDTTTQIIREYNSGPLCTVTLSGQKVAYAEPDGSQPDGTTFATDSLTFEVVLPMWHPNASQDDPGIRPQLQQAVVHAEAISRLTGDSTPVSVQYANTYVKNEQDAADVILQVAASQALPGVVFSGTQAGGLAQPNFNVVGFSRTHGPVGGGGKGSATDSLKTLAKDSFDPSDFFNVNQATLFGGITLSDVIKTGLDLGSAPKISTSHTATAVDATISWTSAMQNKTVNGLNFAGDGGTVVVYALVHTDLSGKNSSSTVTATLSNFSIELMASCPVIKVQFSSFQFESATGKKPTFTPNVDSQNGVTYEGALAFLQALGTLLGPLMGSTGGGGSAWPGPGIAPMLPVAFADRQSLFAVDDSSGSGPSLDVTASGVTAGYTLAVPNISIGVFALQNIKVGASVTLPFDGSPVELDFQFGQREDPIEVSVWGITGGAYLGLGLNAKGGLTQFEGSVEFGGSLSINLIVASGSAHLMAGIYFEYDSDPTTNPNATSGGVYTIEGYVHCGGSLSVLEIISVSIELDVDLGFQVATDGSVDVFGDASVSVGISLLWFSASVSVSCHVQFGSASGSLGGSSDYRGQTPEMLPAADAAGITDGAPIPGFIPPTPPLEPEIPLPFTDVMDAADWLVYMGAFVPVK